jgi:hypothetical protein
MSLAATPAWVLRRNAELAGVSVYDRGRADGTRGYPASPADFSVTERGEYLKGHRDGMKARRLTTARSARISA